MTTTSHWCGALALALSLPLAHAQTSPSNATNNAADTQGAREARTTRQAQAEKQKQLFEEKNIPAAAQAGPTATPIDVPLDEADAPGAVKQ